MKEEKSDKTGDTGNVCAVCGDRATGIHYRVQSCEGCKGFWRRTIQRNMGNKYTCKVWTETCPVTPETRGRCQRCRYLACTRAGMVADLVMADKERLSRLRLVDQNREKRRAQKGLTTNINDKLEQDGKLLEMLHTLYGQFLLPTINQDPSSVSRAAYSFVECLLFQLMGQRDMRDVVMSAHTEVAAIHLLTTRPALELMCIPLMSELSLQVTSLNLIPSEIVLCMAMSASRPRLTWPQSSRQELNMLWDLMAGTVRRSVTSARMTAMLQLVHQVQAVTFYLGPGPLAMYPPSSMSAASLAGPAGHGMYPMMPSVPMFTPPTPMMQIPGSHLPASPYQHNMPLPGHQLPLTPSHHPAPAAPDTPTAPVTSLHAPVPLYPGMDKTGVHQGMSSSTKLTPTLDQTLLHTPAPTIKLPELSLYSPPSDDNLEFGKHLSEVNYSVKREREEDSEELVSPVSNVPLKKRKCNLYSEILQEAINSTLN